MKTRLLGIFALICIVIPSEAIMPASVQSAAGSFTPSESSQLLGPRAPSAGNIVINGNFENPTANWDMNTYLVGATFGSWTVESGDVQLIAATRWQDASAAGNGQSVDLNGSSAGAIYQDLVTIPGQSYSLSFALSGNPEGAPTLKQMGIWWGTNIVDTVSFDVTGHSDTSMGWTPKQYSVVATSTISRLTFRSLVAGYFGPALDEVAVTGSAGYSISGRVTDGAAGLSDVRISDLAGHSTVATNGDYTLSGLGGGTYTLQPAKTGYSFSPVRSAPITLPSNPGDVNFIAIPDSGPPAPFLDLPFAYGGTARAFLRALNNTDIDGGRIISWFDHKYPDYGLYGGVWLYRGQPHTNLTQSYPDYAIYCYGGYCYDGHNGIDFTYLDPNPETPGSQDLPILPAHTGKVVEFKIGCAIGNWDCGGGYGNYVVLQHQIDAQHGYYTLYGHLASVNTPKVAIGAILTRSDSLGMMGTTGRSTDTHLHFSVFRDNGNGTWDNQFFNQDSDRVVDPFGWKREVTDPWAKPEGAYSAPLWLYSPYQEVTFAGCQGTVITDPTNSVEAAIPPCVFLDQTTMELFLGPAAGIVGPRRGVSRPFTLRLLQGLMSEGSPDVRASRVDAQSQLSQSITITATYEYNDVKHSDIQQLSLYSWDENQQAWQPLPSVVDAAAQTAVAQTAVLGDFVVQAPPLCSGDAQEPDDSFSAATGLSTDGVSLNRWFDISQDEDWFRMNVRAGARYEIRTSHLAAGVDTTVQIYDLGGLAQLAFDDNGGGGKASRLVWQAPQSGTYFVRVAQSAGSAYGCTASYKISAGKQPALRLFFPFIRK